MGSNDAVEEFLAARFREILGSRPWLLVGEFDHVATGMASVLRRLGAADVLAVGISTGTGPVDPSVPLLSVGERSEGSMMDGIRHAQAVVDDLPARIVDAVDSWDPDRRAAVMVPFVFRAGAIAGRSTWGARPAAWEALEDKLVAESIWSSAGIEHEPAIVVDLTDEDGLLAAHRLVASASGSVLAGDSRSGWHGGASGVRWIPDEPALPGVVADLVAHHDRVRVMPFLEGIPCSIHGLVTAGGVAAFRPCEMIVLRDRDVHRFEYAAAATFWDPPAVTREEMRSAARAVGRELFERADFRGVFTIDGVATERGFRPTELNARFGAGAALVGRGRAQLPLFVTSSAIIAGDLDGLDLTAFESWTVAGADAERQGRTRLASERPPLVDSPEMRFVLADDGAVRPAEIEDDDVIAVATWEPAAAGGAVIVDYTESVPVGPPTAPLAAQIARHVDERWGLGLGSLEAPRPQTG